MKKNRHINQISILSVAFLCSCTGRSELYDANSIESQEAEKVEINTTVKLDEDQITSWEEVLKFAKKVSGEESRSVFDTKDLKVTNVEKEIINLDHTQETMLAKSESRSIETFRYTFEKDGEEGFAIATNDKRINRVLAFVEKGSIADTAIVPGMAYQVKRFKDVLAYDLDSYYNKSTMANEPMNEWTLPSFFKTSWHTKEPYNNNYEKPSTPCDLTSNEKYQASSTAVCFAQCLVNYPSDYDVPPVFSNKYNIAGLIEEPKIYEGDAMATEVASYVRQFDIDGKTIYRCIGTSTDFDYEIPVLNNLGFDSRYYYNLYKHDIIKTFNNLCWGCPTIYGGADIDFNVEAWIVDGFWGLVNGDVTKIDLVSVHIVFAFGGTGNGWYANPSEPVSSTGTPAYDSGQYYHKFSFSFRPVCPWCVEREN